ncbi:MAG: hypothetical protein ACTHQQ_18275 [Solirubrobacteraceae bacterium]
MKGRGIFTTKTFALAAACALVCAGGGLALASQGPFLQGNRQGINLARHVLSAFSGQPAFNYTQRGFFQMNSAPGKTPNVSFYYGYGTLRPGFAWAAERGTVALNSDRVVWWRDDLTPLSNPNGHEVPVELVANGQGVFSALGSASRHSCYTRVSGSVPYPSGGQAYSIIGRYENGSSPLHSVYRWWQTGQAASETDVISGSGLITSGRIAVSPGAGLAGFTVSFNNFYPGGAPAAPQINLCR